jgi:acyl-CoA synthetase (AMP-forming)/AMP-acid ligase II
VSVTNMASTMVALLVSSPLAPHLDLASLRVVSCGGSPQAPAVVRRAVALLGCEFFVSYGMTECCGKISMSILPEGGAEVLGAQEALELVCTSGRPFRLLQVGAVCGGEGGRGRRAAAPRAHAHRLLLPSSCCACPAGSRPALPVPPTAARSTRCPTLAPCRPSPPQVRVVAEDGADVAPGSGQVGEVLVRGPTLFAGYQGLPAADAESFAPGGWFRTGDLAQLRAGGYLAVVDRRKDMVGRWLAGGPGGRAGLRPWRRAGCGARRVAAAAGSHCPSQDGAALCPCTRTWPGPPSAQTA